MAGNLIPLDEAAKLLGKTVDELTDLRSRNEIFGYRDGSSWKFKMEEINRFADEQGISLSLSGSAEDLSSDTDLVADAPGDIPLEELDIAIDLGSGSDVDEGGASESHVLSGSDLEPGDSPSDTGKMNDNDDDLLLAEDDLFGEDDEISLEEESSGDISLDSDSEMLSDFDDESSMMLEDDSSEIALDAADSGVNLRPTDSGLSLDEEPLELGGSDINALELPEDSGIDLINPSESGSDLSIELDEVSSGIDVDLAAESDLGLVGSGLNIELPEAAMDLSDGSGIDLSNNVQADNDFMLTPLEGEVEDESSGSQVIALEDSEIYADDSAEIVSDSSHLESGPLEVAEGAVAPMFEEPAFGVDQTFAPSPAAAPAPAMSVEQPIPVWMIAIQAICLIFLLAAGVIAIDLARNMFEFNEQGSVTARLTEWIIDFTGYFKK